MVLSDRMISDDCREKIDYVDDGEQEEKSFHPECLAHFAMPSRQNPIDNYSDNPYRQATERSFHSGVARHDNEAALHSLAL